MKIYTVILVLLLLPLGLKAQKSYPVGLQFSDFEYNKVPKRYFAVRGSRSMPMAHSLKQYCPKPLNQLDLRTSSGWAAAYAALTIVKAEQNRWSKSEIMQNVYAPAYPIFMAKKDNGIEKDEELTLNQVIAALKKYGTPKYRELPSRSLTTVSQETEDKAMHNRISEYARLYEKLDTRLTKITTIKATLNENLPVIIAMHTPPSFSYAKEFWQPREEFSKDIPGHAMTIVGYDDSKFGGAFEVMNSWGSDWGNEGFMWIKYDDLIEFSEDAYDIYVIPGKTSGVELGGSIELKLVEDNSFMELEQLSPGYYKIAKSYPSGTTFTIRVNNESPAFIYAFASDLTGQIFPFFPPTYTSAALSKATSFYIPDANTPAMIDDTIGTDYLCVLFSKEDLDIAHMFGRVTYEKGSFLAKMRTVLGDKLVNSLDVQYDPDKAEFKLVKSDKSIVMLIIEHDHR